jgi:hypothetical protein
LSFFQAAAHAFFAALSCSINGLKYNAVPSPFSTAYARTRSNCGCANTDNLCKSAFCASENRPPYCDKIACTRTVASACPSAVNFGDTGPCAACSNSGTAAAVAAVNAALAPANPTGPIAAATPATRRANSRREIPAFFSSSIRSPPPSDTTQFAHHRQSINDNIIVLSAYSKNTIDRCIDIPICIR